MADCRRCFMLVCLFVLASTGSAVALVVPQDAGRFDAKAVLDPAPQVAVAAESPEAIPGFDVERDGWESFRREAGGEWSVHIDRRSGAPLLVQGPGLRWFDPDRESPSLDQLEAKARQFVARHSPLLKVGNEQLIIDLAASAAVDRDHWILVFGRAVDGVPVEGQRFLLYVTRGNLVAFGADRWGPIDRVPPAVYGAATAREVLYAHMGILPRDVVTELEAGTKILVPSAAAATGGRRFSGRVGGGTTFRLAFRFVLRVEGERGTWVGKVDAVTGEVISLVDDDRYAQVKGGIFPISSDGRCPDGCEQPAFPMPYADVTVGGTPQTASAMGLFTCSGGVGSTTLAGPYVRISDACGAVVESVTCDADLDLKTGPGTNCTVPAGSSAGNTHASRTAFYNVNRFKEKIRRWLPGNAWLDQQLEVDVNVNATCNASWGGTLNMYRAGNGCGNTAEIAGVLLHEFGHGLDQNDGGGYDNPSEAYADVTAQFATRASCVGRGFDATGANCSGYGDACLDCTGIRDDDWNKRAARTPATPQGFVQSNCGGGGGPCGKEEHCEGYVGGETIYDLATRDLPASGLDADTAWQLAEKLFFKSRQGSGGNAYNCALPSSDGCNAGSWFNSIRNVDDDDGNLANGTPHAAAIFAAFKRHNIACGNVSDASNQSTSSCPSLAAPAPAAVPGANTVTLSWAAVPSASSYLILRNEQGCAANSNIVATVAAPATSYADSGLPNGLGLYYRVQAVGANVACESAVSACQAVVPLPRKGEVILNKGAYGCSDSIGIQVQDLDLNANSSVIETVTVAVTSTTDPLAETVVLTETGPATAQFTGSIATAPGAAVAGDGVLQTANGDAITVTYRDADDGTGRSAITFRTSTADCAGPTIGNVRVTDLTDDSAIVRWDTSEPSTSRVEWGTTTALGSVASDATGVTAHALTIRPLLECGRTYFRVTSTDALGNTASRDVAGTPYAFNANIMPGLFRDSFEASSGWTLEGEWQIAGPQGKGNGPDPSTAYEGTKVLGHDLTGLGARLGDYEPAVTQRAISPVINASALTGGTLKFRRWLNTGGSGSTRAYVEVKKAGVWNVVYTSPSLIGVGEQSWSFQSIDISQYADANSQLQIAFRQTGGSSTSTRAGWNVDRVVVKSASVPDYQVCGGCGGGPTFGGVAAASDLAGCAATGVSVTWQPAAAWGTGTSGTYSVYRDTVPGFTPSAANRIATGLTATSYTDAAPPTGVSLYYLVRSENNETCSSGPKNGGVTDTNTVYASTRDDVSQPAPGAVGDTLVTSGVNAAHVRLSWSAAAGAASYRVYRADVPQGPFTRIATVPGLVFEDLGEIPSGSNRFYDVRAADSCGNESP